MKKKIAQLTWSIVLLTALTQRAWGEPVTTIRNNGDSANRVDLVVLGDGYSAGEIDKYSSDVESFVQGLFAQEPLSEYQHYFNVHRVDVISNQSGADHPERNPQVFRDTALDATYNCAGIQRLICVSIAKVNNVLSRSVPPDQREVILVIVNDTEYGGSGGAIAVASINSLVVELVLHELGHSFGLLADEYTDTPPPCNNTVEPAEPNVTKETFRSLIKWNVGGSPPKGWIELSTPVPTNNTTAGIPGLYQGAKYCTVGLYRPTFNSKMRSLAVPFEQINSEQLVKRIYNWASPIDSSEPPDSTVKLASGQVQTFGVQIPQPLNHSLDVTWKVNGNIAATTKQFTFSATGAGSHTVEVFVSDPTVLVRNDPANVLKETRRWDVIVKPVDAATPRIDFDDDGKIDIAVYRDGIWYVIRSSDGAQTAVGWGGLPQDRPVPADYDGDGKTDIAVYRDGTWFILRSSNGGVIATDWGGLLEDIPVPADYDGDGLTDIAIYRGGGWFIRRSSDGLDAAVGFGGLPQDIPVPADYDGDGLADIALYRDGTWFILRSSNGGVTVTGWGGLPQDILVPGDYDGDGKADISVYRDGAWFILRSFDGGVTATGWGGLPQDIPLSQRRRM